MPFLISHMLLLLSPPLPSPSLPPSSILLSFTTCMTCHCSFTLADHIIYKVVQSEFELTKIVPVQRKYFNESIGVRFAETLGINNEQNLINSSKYLCMAAAGCLIKYVEHTQNISFASRTMNINFCSLDGHMKLDSATVAHLELVSNLRKPARTRTATLYSVLNTCKTGAGARLLRQNIMQPLTDQETIRMRQDAVAELLQSETTFFGVCQALPQLFDLDAVNAQLIQIPKSTTLLNAQQAISNILLLKQSLILLPQLGEALSDCKTELLRTIGDNFAGDTRTELLQNINSHVQQEAVTTRRKTEPTKRRSQLAYALKAGLNGLLDVARSTYYGVIEDIHRELENYRVQHGIGELRMEFTASRGYHLSFPRTVLDSLGDRFPEDLFVQPVQRGRRIFCTTDTLSSLDQRQRESFNEILLLTVKEVQVLLSDIRMQMGWLFTVSESIALLDMLVCVLYSMTVCGCNFFVFDLSSPVVIVR
jgi:DNA mismatch repair protein MSH4